MTKEQTKLLQDLRAVLLGAMSGDNVGPMTKRGMWEALRELDEWLNKEGSP
jgi:hypothetical protein